MHPVTSISNPFRIIFNIILPIYTRSHRWNIPFRCCNTFPYTRYISFRLIDLVKSNMSRKNKLWSSLCILLETPVRFWRSDFSSASSQNTNNVYICFILFLLTECETCCERMMIDSVFLREWKWGTENRLVHKFVSDVKGSGARNLYLSK